MLKGKDTWETIENYCILFILIGGIVMASGFGLSIAEAKGASAIMAMSGAFVIFMSVIVLIFSWVAKELM